jgi:hypothetical protein
MSSVQQLIMLGKGDRGRLEYILDLLQEGKILPSSDQQYLENIIPLYLESSDMVSLKPREFAVEELYEEIQTLNQKISKLEGKGFQRYIGKKTMLFFVTVFVGWNALQALTSSVLNSFMSDNTIQYLFPLTVLANYLNAGSLVGFVFILLVLAWPFIGAIHLANFIRTRKKSNEP